MIDLDFQLQRGPFTLDVSLSSDSRVTGLIGPSGGGKTSLIMALIGILKPSRGSIGIRGQHEFFNSARGVNLPIEKRRLGVVFQENLLFPHLNVKENLLFGYKRTDPALRRLQPEEIFELLDLGTQLDRGVGNLSGGEQRRVAIGRALLTSPCLLLLDEPLTGLDVNLRDRILAYLLRLKKELSIPMIYASHSFNDISTVADSVALLTVETNEHNRKHSRVSRLGHPLDILSEAAKVVSIGSIETVIEGEIVSTNPLTGHSVVHSEGLEMYVSPDNKTPGSRCYVTIRADDIIISVGEPPKLSSRNVWAGTIKAFENFQNTVVVTIDVGHRIRAALTEESVRELGLAEGMKVHAIVKAKSLRTVVLGSKES